MERFFEFKNSFEELVSAFHICALNSDNTSALAIPYRLRDGIPNIVRYLEGVINVLEAIMRYFPWPDVLLCGRGNFSLKTNWSSEFGPLNQ